MAFNNLRSETSKDNNKLLLRPYHYVGLFDRTFSSAQRGEGVVCTMLSVASVEAFINDVEGLYSYAGANPISFHKNDRLENILLDHREIKLLRNLKNAEKLRKPLEYKIQLFGIWDKNNKLYQQFTQLIRIRNGIVHSKPEELSIDKTTGEYSGYPKYLNNLIQNKVITKPDIAMSWIEALEGREYCLWCQNVSYQVIQQLTKMLPNTRLSKHFSSKVHIFLDQDKFRWK